LLAEKEDESCDSIGALFGNSPRTVSNWLKRLNKTGDIESLRRKKQSGRPSRLTDEQKHDLKTVLHDLPEKHGITSNVWDGKSLSAYIERHYGVILQTRACQRLFHELGFSLKRVRPMVARAPMKKRKRRQKKLQEKIESGDYELFFED
jgi:transposase